MILFLLENLNVEKVCKSKNSFKVLFSVLSLLFINFISVERNEFTLIGLSTLTLFFNSIESNGDDWNKNFYFHW